MISRQKKSKNLTGETRNLWSAIGTKVVCSTPSWRGQGGLFAGKVEGGGREKQPKNEGGRETRIPAHAPQT